MDNEAAKKVNYYRDASWPTPPAGSRRLVGHLFEDRAHLVDFIRALGERRPTSYDDPLEAGAYTDGQSDFWSHEYVAWRNALKIGTVKVNQHEVRHILVQGPYDEGGVVGEKVDHHHFPIAVSKKAPWIRFRKTCAWLGLCVAAEHGARFIEAHNGGFTEREARELTRLLRTATPDEYGVRHAYLDIPEARIALRQP